MELSEEVAETSEKVVGWLEDKKVPAHYEELMRKTGLNLYREQDRRTMSNTLSFLEQEGVIKRIRDEGPYALA